MHSYSTSEYVAVLNADSQLQSLSLELSNERSRQSLPLPASVRATVLLFLSTYSHVNFSGISLLYVHRVETRPFCVLLGWTDKCCPSEANKLAGLSYTWTHGASTCLVQTVRHHMHVSTTRFYMCKLYKKLYVYSYMYNKSRSSMQCNRVWQRSTGPKEMRAWVACFLHLHACMHARIDAACMDQLARPAAAVAIVASSCPSSSDRIHLVPSSLALPTETVEKFMGTRPTRKHHNQYRHSQHSWPSQGWLIVQLLYNSKEAIYSFLFRSPLFFKKKKNTTTIQCRRDHLTTIKIFVRTPYCFQKDGLKCNSLLQKERGYCSF